MLRLVLNFRKDIKWSGPTNTVSFFSQKKTIELFDRLDLLAAIQLWLWWWHIWAGHSNEWIFLNWKIEKNKRRNNFNAAKLSKKKLIGH